MASYEPMYADLAGNVLEAGGQSDEGLMELLVDFDIGEEFLVMIVEYDGTAARQAVHIHKITKVGLNQKDEHPY